MDFYGILQYHKEKSRSVFNEWLVRVPTFVIKTNWLMFSLYLSVYEKKYIIIC